MTEVAVEMRDRTMQGKIHFVQETKARAAAKKEWDETTRSRARQSGLEAFSEAQYLIGVAADNGRSEYTYSVASFETDLPDLHVDTKARTIKALLEAEGFIVQIGNYALEPVGSDPIIPYTTYTTYLHISW